MEHLYFHIRLSRADMLDIFRNVREPLYLQAQETPDALFYRVRESEDLHSILEILQE